MNNKCKNYNNEEKKKEKIKNFNKWFIQNKHKMNHKDYVNRKIHIKM